MREVISVHVGQAGVQIGNACCMSFFLLFCIYAFVAVIMAWKTHGKRVASVVLKFTLKWHDADLIICRGALHR